jgi:peptidoglycan/LPS O-acetylase OafA/YrhL
MAYQKTSEQQTIHLGYLDATRGIAALIVVVFHFINWKHDKTTWAKLLSIVFNGADAVSFFFVLSGFVLSYKTIVLGQSLDIGKFYVNRLFRLWPAFFFTVFINAIYWYRHDLNFGYLANQFLLNQTDFWNEAILLRGHPHYYVPSWTLVIELAMSFMVPFFIVIALKGVRLLLWLSLALLLIGSNMGDAYMFHFNFILGVFLSCSYSYIVSSDFKLSKWYRRRHLLLIAAVVLFSIKHIARLFPFPDAYFRAARWVGAIDFFPFTAIASFVFLVFIIQSPAAKRLLQHNIFIRLGRISYSIYLMHWLPLVALHDHWARIRPLFPNATVMFITMLACVVVVTLVLASITYRLIELPFIRLGKRLTGKMKPTFIIENIIP